MRHAWWGRNLHVADELPPMQPPRRHEARRRERQQKVREEFFHVFSQMVEKTTDYLILEILFPIIYMVAVVLCF